MSSLLEVHPGVTAVAGSGGKTTLLESLGRELSSHSSVILCTTTRFRRFDAIPGGMLCSTDEVKDALSRHNLFWVGTPAEGGKWAEPTLSISALAALADYVIVEADGSAGRPLKAHRNFEPVIPPESDQTILLLGVDGLGRAVQDAAHCPEIYAELAGCSTKRIVTPEIAARVIRSEGLGTRLLINKVHSDEEAEAAARIAALTDMPAYAGSIWEDTVCSL